PLAVSKTRASAVAKWVVPPSSFSVSGRRSMSITLGRAARPTSTSEGDMSRIVKCGLIQASNPINDEKRPVAQIQAPMCEKHVALVEEAGKKGVQILCLQEIFNGPYFCPSQSPRWYDAAEPVPGPTVQRMQPIAKRYGMAMVVPVYEREMAGVYYNTA